MHDRTTLRALVFDSLDSQIAIIDHTGAIIDVNEAWTRFGAENGISSGFSCVGSNYLEVIDCAFAAGDGIAGEAAKGMADVLAGRRDSFYHEYPCHSPTEKRWFMMSVYPLKGAPDRLFVVSHSNITKRRLAEERAQHLALHDPLTGLANRRYFDQFRSSEVRRAIRDRSTISLVLIDIDHFKEYNDELGHPAGDQCLVEIARALLAHSRRPGDLAARIGGDEFAIVLGSTGVAESQAIAESIRRSVSDLGLVFGGSQRVTVSVGVASITPDDQKAEKFLFDEADRALYIAKSTGRNRVVHAQAVTSPAK
ncbi:MAG TPA: diguanylate cyclase [Thermomicrobiales bacterium]|jgi:diguanylate cyclase (GGDEF)-like protein|nr:diguanylate cyclase [Thermomicrobiales bacterium]